MGAEHCCDVDPAEGDIHTYKPTPLFSFIIGTPTSTSSTRSNDNITPIQIEPSMSIQSSITSPAASPSPVIPNTMQTLQYIEEDEEMIHPANLQAAESFAISTSSETIHHNQYSSYFRSVDMNVTAPKELINYFSDDESISQINKQLCTHFTASTRGTMEFSHVSTSNKDYYTLQPVTLRSKRQDIDAKSIVLDLPEFGLFLKNQNVNEQHIWYETIWNKYDKLDTLKMNFCFLNELLTDLLQQYIMIEYDTNIENIMTVDIAAVLQQIIIHIQSYYEQQVEDEILFTFNDLCCLGDWLLDIGEMEEDDFEDSFIMDYWDMRQYVNAHIHHVWKKVINKAINTNNSTQIIQHIDTNQISDVIELLLIDYGRNGLGNVNMEIYSSQIKEYTNHLSKLFDKWHQSQSEKKCEFIAKKQFFEFVSCIPSL